MTRTAPWAILLVAALLLFTVLSGLLIFAWVFMRRR